MAPEQTPASREAGTGETPEALQAVLFDMDGLLVDTEPLWLEVECDVVERMGGRWTEADQRGLLGGSLDLAVSVLRARSPRPASPEDVARWLLHGMIALLADRGVPLLPGAGELLADVRAAGLPHALVTSSERPIMEAVLAQIGAEFPATVCGSDVRRRKPDPEPYLLAASLLGADPRHCVALEDSPNGVASAEAAGCRIVAVPGMLPIPAADGRVVVGSLTEVSLQMLRSLMDGEPGCRPRATAGPLSGEEPSSRGEPRSGNRV
jgi:HAD superfamily hydrolase (TIGR01509 family)